MSMQKISEAILEKVKLEAQQTIKDAEEKAYELLDASARQQEARFEEAKGNLLAEAEREAARILARSAISARHELSSAKAKLVADIVAKVKESLSGTAIESTTFLKLIKSSLDELGWGKCVLYVAPKDIFTVTNLVKADKDLASIVQEVKPYNCIGGVIIEDATGKNRIDNTYDARLEKLMPQILPEINRMLFKE